MCDSNQTFGVKVCDFEINVLKTTRMEGSESWLAGQALLAS